MLTPHNPVVLATLIALVLNLAVGPSGTLVPDNARGISGAARPAPVPPPPPDVVRGPCVVPADLPRNPSIDYRTAPGDVPADLPGPRFRLPRKMEMSLGQTVPAPAPDYSQLYYGGVEIDTRTGSVAINGQDFSARPVDCP